MLKLATGWLFCLLLLSACGGGGGGGSGGRSASATVPGVPMDITVNAGDRALSLGWSAPGSDGGRAITGYQLDITPRPPAVDIQLSGTRALVSNLDNGVSYQLTVAAINGRGTGDASAPVSAQPEASNPGSYTPISITMNPPAGSANGIYDPALLRAANDDLWLAYSAVDFYSLVGLVYQDVGIRIARSADNGLSFNYETTVASAFTGTVTDTVPTTACGSVTCNGRWVYETSTLVEDPSDPDPNRRYKLFASHYFVYPDSPRSRTLYHLGAIVMFTGSSPTAGLGNETVVLRWPLSPPELGGGQDVTALDPDLSNCLLVAEPGAAVVNGDILLVLACPYPEVGFTDPLQKIVLLRSVDHGASFSYVSTLLTPADTPASVRHFSAPSLLATDDRAPVLLVTDVDSAVQYQGSRVFPLAAEGSNAVFRVLAAAQSILAVPVESGSSIGGASTYSRDTGTLGILQSDAVPDFSTLPNSQFRILSTHAMVEQ